MYTYIRVLYFFVPATPPFVPRASALLSGDDRSIVSAGKAMCHAAPVLRLIYIYVYIYIIVRNFNCEVDFDRNFLAGCA